MRFATSLLQVGDVIYIEANSGAVKRVGRCDAHATEYDLEAEEYVPLPKVRLSQELCASLPHGLCKVPWCDPRHERPRRRVKILVSSNGMSHAMPEEQHISHSLCIMHAKLLVAHPLSLLASWKGDTHT